MVGVGRSIRLQQFAAAQRAGQVDFLPRQIAAQIERAGIEEIARRLRSQQRLDAVASAQAWRRISFGVHYRGVHSRKDWRASRR